LLSTPSLGITTLKPNQNKRVPQARLSTPSLGITSSWLLQAQKVSAYRLSTPSLGITSRAPRPSIRLALSTPSLGITQRSNWETGSIHVAELPFNSLSRDHGITSFPARLGYYITDKIFQLPLSGSLREAIYQCLICGLSTPSLGITSVSELP